MTRLIRPLLLIFCGIAFALGFGEILTRVLLPKPNSDLENNTNEAVTTDQFRIVVLGDSFVEALQVQMDKNFHQILERELNERKVRKTFEVIGLGRSGNGSRGNFEFLSDL